MVSGTGAENAAPRFCFRRIIRTGILLCKAIADFCRFLICLRTALTYICSNYSEVIVLRRVSYRGTSMPVFIVLSLTLTFIILSALVRDVRSGVRPGGFPPRNQKNSSQFQYRAPTRFFRSGFLLASCRGVFLPFSVLSPCYIDLSFCG